MKILLSLILGVFCMAGFNASAAVNDGMIVRIAKIEVEPNYLDEYLVFLKENGEASLEKEKGVISLFAMQDKEKPNLISIVEIYKDQETYQQHIKTAHFQKYKTGTIKMVKKLELIDMDAVDPTVIGKIFVKAE